MRPTLIIAALAALSLTAACSPSDNDRASADGKDTGRAADGGSSSVSPDLKSAQADLKKAGHTAATDLRKLAAEAKVEAHKLAADTRGAAHDVTHHDKSAEHG